MIAPRRLDVALELLDVDIPLPAAGGGKDRLSLRRRERFPFAPRAPALRRERGDNRYIPTILSNNQWGAVAGYL
ncbi:MAG: hypothetical protein ACRDJE_22430 [Dehalococcoidia bacterium]